MVGKFCWVELLTSDVEAAKAFYTEVIGWTCVQPDHAPRGYQMFSVGGGAVAGLLQLPEEARAQGAGPSWCNYIASPDVDADVAAIVVAGGKLYRPAETLPNIGRFAVVADPQGAVFALWTDLMGHAAPETAPMTPGHVGWRELMTEDLEKGFAFYAQQFGWTKADDMDMGPMGIYRLFATGGNAVGGMMKRPAAVPHSFWGTYFVVEALDAAMARVTKAGGQIVNGPQEVPGGAWIAQALDPQGAYFAMVAMKR